MKATVKGAAEYFALILKALRFWRREPHVTTLGELVKFVETRSKFIAQTTLYGYVRTRAGTRYVALLEDPVFANSVNIAKWEIYLVCLADLAIYAAALVGRAAPCKVEELQALAIYLVSTATLEEETPKERPQGFADIRKAFRTRAKSFDWGLERTGEDYFQDSLSALVEWAPVADELKQFDVEIVKNSMRFKWKKVRDQLIEILDAGSVLAEWRSTGTAADEGAA